MWDTESGAFHVLQETPFIYDSNGVVSYELDDSLLFASYKQLCLLHIQSGVFTCKTIENQSTKDQNLRLSALQSSENDKNILIYWEIGNSKQIYHFTSNLKFIPLNDIKRQELNPFILSKSSSLHYFARYSQLSSNSLEIFSAKENPEEFITWEIPISSQEHGSIKDLFIDSSNSKYLIVSNDHSISFYDNKQSTLNWIREESLASIHMSKFMEIPSPVIDVELLTGNQNDGILMQFIHRIVGQIENVKEYLLSELQTEDEHDLLLRKDRFGFNKLLLLASKTGKLFCISNQVSHETIWTLWFQGEEIEDLLITRLATTSDSVLLVLTKVNR